jgi:hypothetical protein
MAYMEDYRKGMNRDYRQKVDYALQQTRQRESLTGRRSSPQERAAIVAGVLRPQAQAYSQDYMRGLALEESRRQWGMQYDLRKKALKQQKKADEISGIAEFAKLGLGAAAVGNQYYGNYQRGQQDQFGYFDRKQIDLWQEYYGPGGPY